MTVVAMLTQLAKQMLVEGAESDIALEVYADGSGVVSHVVKNEDLEDDVGSVNELFAWNNEEELIDNLAFYISLHSSKATC